MSSTPKTKTIVYAGPSVGVFIENGQELPKGEPVAVPAELADRLLEQATFRPSSKTPKTIDPDAPTERWARKRLDAAAELAGLDPAQYPTKADILSALEDAGEPANNEGETA